MASVHVPCESLNPIRRGREDSLHQVVVNTIPKNLLSRIFGLSQIIFRKLSHSNCAAMGKGSTKNLGGDESEDDQPCLAKDWMDLDGMQEQGAAGRLVVAPAVLSRADLDYNWQVILAAMLRYGARVAVDTLQPDVERFFGDRSARSQYPVPFLNILW